MNGNNIKRNDSVIRSRKKTATTVLRVLMGVLFIFSGLVKLNDPLGLVFKIQEYFSEGVFNIPLPFTLIVDGAGTLITFEIVLGALLIMGRFKIFTLWSVLLLNAGFFFLTLYSAVTGKVPDCGCFGDAVHLSPWVSFAKNVLILAAIVVLIMWQRFIKPIVGFRKTMSILALIFAFSIGVIYYVLRYEPVIDFRPYKVGVNIPEAMQMPEGEDRPVFGHVWVYRVDGRDKKFTDQDEPWNIEGAEFVSRQTKLLSGKLPQITGFSVMSPDGEDISDSLLAMDHVLLVTCFDLKASRAENWERMNAYIREKGVPAFVLADTDDAELIRERGIVVPVCFTDPITVKTILRSNPGVMELEKGTITDKRSCFNLGR